jgi:hypothetical protein
MPRITKIQYFTSILLVLIYVTSSFSGVEGWCVESGKVNILTQIEVLDCHSGSAESDDTTPFDTRPSHATQKHPCTTCYDIKPDILATKLLDDSFGSLAAPPASNPLFLVGPFSGLKTFAIASPGIVTATAQSPFLQTLQNKAIRTVVLLI